MGANATSHGGQILAGAQRGGCLHTPEGEILTLGLEVRVLAGTGFGATLAGPTERRASPGVFGKSSQGLQNSIKPGREASGALQGPNVAGAGGRNSQYYRGRKLVAEGGQGWPGGE